MVEDEMLKTDDLIAALAADNSSREAPLGRSLALDLAVGFLVSATPFFIFIGLRDSFFASLDQPRFLFKFLFTGVMAVTGLVLAWRLARPVAALGQAPRAIWLAPALVVIACVVEMATTPEGQWGARMIGHNAMHCLMLVPIMSLAPLAGLFLALRSAAPSDPHRAGAAAAFASAGLAAALYATNCPDDSPFFLAVWYMLATMIVVALGWFAGGRWLRW
jgi:hypothetical protein